MAKDTAKKNARRNAVRMYVFTCITVAVNVVYLLVILYHNGGLPGFADVLAIAFWAGQEYVALSSLKSVAAPVRDVTGQLLDCIDAANPAELGIYSFAQDVLWVCWVVQLLCCVHPAFVVFYLPVPATAIYKLCTSALRPLVMGQLLGSSGSGSDGSSNKGNDNNGGGDGGSNAPRNRQERRREELQARKARRRGAAAA